VQLFEDVTGVRVFLNHSVELP